MAEVWGTVATVAAAAVGIAATAYSASGAGLPKQPNLASASREVADAQANALPINRALASAEQQGSIGTVHVSRHSERQQFVRVPGLGREGRSQIIPYVPSEWESGGKYAGQGGEGFDPAQHLINRSVKVPAHDQSYDFSGFGTADVSGKLAGQMADIQTELGKKYGVPFAEEARREAEQADPMGFAARGKELDLINQKINNPIPINPLATTLDARMKERVEAGSGLDDMSRDVLDAAVARAGSDRGGGPAASGVETNLTTGREGAARRQANDAQAQAWLSSGATPEDVQYRREQQNLSDLGQFVAGKTPQSQFPSLSNAGQGATPFVPGQSLPTQPNNASTTGPAYSLATWQQQLRNAGAGANWMSALGGALGGIGATATNIANPGG